MYPTFQNLRYSVGFGFRWFSPIGPLRFEWGIPLTRRPEDDRMEYSFELQRAEVRIPAHKHDLEHRVVEREMRVLRHDRQAARVTVRDASSPRNGHST